MDFSKYFKKKNDSKVKIFSKLEIFEKVNDEELIEVSGGNFSRNLRQKRLIAGLTQKELGNCFIRVNKLSGIGSTADVNQV